MASTLIALIRGINVGRAKRVAMADLRALVEGLGAQDADAVEAAKLVLLENLENVAADQQVQGGGESSGSGRRQASEAHAPADMSSDGAELGHSHAHAHDAHHDYLLG